MNRIFKFRAWDKRNGGFKYFDFGDCLPVFGYEKEFIVQQFTELKDCDEKEIYEGDILISKVVNVFGKKEIWQVQFQDCQFCAVNEKTGQCYRIGGWAGKIIGNIFENPELLNE